MRTTTIALCAAAPLWAACASDTAGQGDREGERSAQAQAQALGALERSRQLFEAGEVREAMVELDAALSIEGPAAAEVEFLRGECALRMGDEDQNPFFYEDARASFLAAAETGSVPAAWFGAARATWMLSFQSGEPAQLQEALELLARGQDDRQPGSEHEAQLAHSPERTLAEVRFSAYTSARNGTLDAGLAPELFEATRDAVEAEIGLDPTASWGWGQLTNLYLWEGRREDARKTIATGIELAPEQSDLHDTQVRLAQEDGGWQEVHDLYEAFALQHDGLAIGHWWLGRAHYELALARMLENKSDESEAFARAQDELRRARKLEPEYTQACLGYEVICRDGLGWSLYHAGDWTGAEEAFWSMEELFEGGMRWEVAGQLFSGVQSLAFVVAAYNAEWEKAVPPGPEISLEEGLPWLVRAADLSTRLFEYDPESWNHANNAGYFNRDLAVQMEAAGTAALDQPARAGEYFMNAVTHMERSYEAYVHAAKLAPGDARTVNDTGLILAYYLQRDLELAEAYFEDAIAVGLPRLEAGIEDEEDRTMTREAVGDSYQNLGVLELTLRGDAVAARTHFQKSLEYERNPRVMVTRFYLPLCDLIEKGHLPASKVQAAHYWKDLDYATVRAREAAMDELRAALSAN